MSGAQGGAHGRDDADGLGGAELAALQDLGQGASVTAFHDQVGAPVGKHSGVDQRDRVRVPADPAGGRHLPHETSAVALVVQRPGVDLDSHWAPQRDLLPGVDGGESSLTQHLSQTDTGYRRRHVPRSTGNREGTAHGHMIVASVHRRKPIGYWSVSPRPLAVGSRRRSKKYQNRTWAPVVRFSRSRQPGYVLAMLRIWT